ncbi:MAG TPA: beta galactosidase jelly roll domain-containing protein, partial [Verrucomicrobiae bacterium]
MLLSTLTLLSASARDVLPLDNDWYFLKADVLGADQPAFDDSSWRKVNVPHDWSIEGPFAQTNLTGGAGAFLPSGVAWYRKHFSLPSDALERRVFVEFDGVMQNSSVWINGRYLGHRPNGYVSFRYELPTSALAFGNG